MASIKVVLTADYVAGFIDGEGCFELGVSRTNKAKLRYGWRPRVRFSIVQKQKEVLELVQEFFGLGKLKFRADGYYGLYFEHRKVSLGVGVPVFDTLPLIVKKDAYKLWREAIIMLGPGKTHHSPEVYHRYLDLRAKINPGRGRRRKVPIEILREAIQ